MNFQEVPLEVFDEKRPLKYDKIDDFKKISFSKKEKYHFVPNFFSYGH